MKIVAIANQKGGVGKTTTSVNLAASLAVAEQNVLLLDLDPQGNATSAYGLGKNDLDQHVYHCIVDHVPMASVIQRTEVPNLDICPTNTDLVGAEIELVAAVSRETRLRTALAPLEDRYDYVLVDCPPSLGLLTLNALTAAHTVLVPLQCEYYALEGLSHLLATIELVRTSLNPALCLEGILLTMFDRRNRLSYQVQREVVSYFGDEVMKTAIPRNVRLSESPSFGKPALLYDVAASGTRAYLELASEFLARQNTPVRPSATPHRDHA